MTYILKRILLPVVAIFVLLFAALGFYWGLKYPFLIASLTAREKALDTSVLTPDSAMLELFQKQREAFNQLRTLCLQDATEDVYYFSYKLNESDLPAERRSLYKEALAKVGINEVSCSFKPRQVWLPFSEGRRGFTSLAFIGKGFLYSEDAETPQNNSLDNYKFDPPDSPDITYRRVEDGWQLYIRFYFNIAVKLNRLWPNSSGEH